jgi:hypothetical protein
VTVEFVWNCLKQTRCEKEDHFLPAGLLISLTDKSLPTVAYFSVAEVTDVVIIIIIFIYFFFYLFPWHQFFPRVLEERFSEQS